MTRIAVLWSRFGPYHLARLRGAAEAGTDRGAEIVGLEVATADRQYAWAQAVAADSFHRETVFPGENYHDKSRREISGGVRRVLERIDPEVVAANGWSVAEARAALEWARRKRRRCVVMSESKADDHRRPVWKEWVKRVLVVKRYDAALVGGRAQAEYLARLGFPKERIELGYDAVDNAYFADGAAVARAEAAKRGAELGLPNQYFFACTRFLERKNLDGLLLAYARYRVEVGPVAWGLVIAGSGGEQAKLQVLDRKLGLAGVLWAGFVQYPELPTYFGLAGAFVHPAKAEPWGLVVNEAAASGVPVLVSRTVGAAHELVREGENGFLLEPHDVEQMAVRMRQVAEMGEEARSAMGAASERIVAAWGPERFGRGLLRAAGY